MSVPNSPSFQFSIYLFKGLSL